MNLLKKYSVLAGLVLLAFSCDEFALDAINPVDSVPLELAVTDANSAGAARAGVYNELQDATLVFDGYLASYLYFSDDCDWTGTFPTRAEFADFNVLPGNGTMGAVWADYYDVINTANALLDVLPAVEDVSLDDVTRNSLLAEARFARAIAYWHLATGWSGVPLILTPTVSVGEELNVPASTEDQIMAQVVDDAQFAANNLAEGKTLGMTVAGANALLARVALYQGRFDDAQNFATAAIGSDYDATSEAYLADELFFLEFNTTDGNSLAFFFGPSELGGRRSISPSAKLVAAYEEGDARFAASIATTLPDGTEVQPYGVKYDDFGTSAGAQTDPIYFFRAAEMVLVLAETAARRGDFDTAEDFLNQIRNRAGLDDIDDMDNDNFLDMILAERYVELAMEGGHRLWDLRRTGRAQDVLGPLGYDPCDNVWPYPQQNIDTNPNLTQNGCCNC